MSKNRLPGASCAGVWPLVQHVGGLLLVAMLSSTAAGQEAAIPINQCPDVVVAEPIKVRLQEMRDKYDDNCLRCTGESCRFIDGLTHNETRICQTLFCQPVRVSERGVLEFPASVSGAFSYRYTLSKRGRPINVELVKEPADQAADGMDSAAREAALRAIRKGLRGRKFRPIELDGQRVALQGLEGTVQVAAKR